jgi:hypothetical protein
MHRLKVTVVDFATKGPSRALYSRLMTPNLASIMPQVIAVWCEEAGHDVRFVCYTGREDLGSELDAESDLVFIGAFTQAAQMAYAVSGIFRRRGAVTVLGGPHARCYPEDAARYFDYVLGYTDRSLIDDVLRERAPHRPIGRCLSAQRQPPALPGVRERWKFIEPTLAKATPLLKIVPMIGSLGCPYTCSFCIDSVVDYQTLGYDQIREDLRFLLGKVKRPVVGWHDPNFGVRFDETMEAIESAVPRDRIDFIAESSLSLLSEPRLARLRNNGFKAILPGIESWFSLGEKSKTGRSQGMAKVKQVAEQVNAILRHIPYVQTNFVMGLDSDEGPEPFELTKRFLDLAPGAFPAYSLLSAFGQSAPLNLEFQREGRVLPFPFHFLNNNHAMNVRPRNYSWTSFYDLVVDLSRYSFSWPAISKRLLANRTAIPRWMNFVRAVSSEGFGRIRYHTKIRRLLDQDTSVRRFFDGETDVLPSFYSEHVRRDLGPFWDALPAGALSHDPNAYLKASAGVVPRPAA